MHALTSTSDAGYQQLLILNSGWFTTMIPEKFGSFVKWNLNMC